MKLAVLSGKGGTGKTTVAVNLASSLAEKGEKVLFLDTDVEEPNAGLYLKPVLEESLPVTIPFPEIDQENCDYCGAVSYTHLDVYKRQASAVIFSSSPKITLRFISL